MGESPLDFLTKTKVDVGYKEASKFNPDASRHIVVLNENNEWVTYCLGSPAIRSFTGWLETAVTCFRCPADYRRGTHRTPGFVAKGVACRTCINRNLCLRNEEGALGKARALFIRHQGGDLEDRYYQELIDQRARRDEAKDMLDQHLAEHDQVPSGNSEEADDG